MAEKDTQIRQIASQLQPKFAAYLRDSSKREGLTADERRVLDAVRSNPSPGQLQSLYNMTKFSNTNVMVRERAFGSLATALGMEPPEARSLWQRLSGGTPTADLPSPPQVATSRVPGGGSAAVRNQPPPPGFYYQTSKVSQVSQPELVRQLAALMRPEFREYLTTGRHLSPTQSLDSERMFLEEGVRQLTAAERQFLDRVRQDPTSVNVQEFRNFAIPGEWTAADPDAPNRQPSVSERISNLLLGERQEQRRFEQSSLEKPDVELGPNQSLQWYGAENAWGIVEGEAGRVPKFLRLLTNEETRRGMLLSPATPSARTPTAGPAPERQVVGTPSSAARPPSKQLPEGQQYVFNRGLNRWEVMDSRGRTIGAVDRAGNIIQDDTGDRGGGVPGAVPGVVPETGMVDTGVPPDWETAAAEMYPEYYAIVKNNPEIADLLRRSLGPPEWSPEKFDAELKKTNWYKTTQASARVWDTQSALDPATYQARVDEAAEAINAEALSYGIRLSDEQLQKLALDSQRLNFGTQQITNAIGMLAVQGGTEGATQLRNGYYGQQIRQTARQYGVTLNDTTFNSFVNKIAVGDESIGSFQDYAMTIAKSLYPTLAEQFDAGRTFEDATSSYKVIAANLLEKDEGEIDMTRPEWVQAITYQPDPKTGEQRLMNMREWQDYLRQTESLGYQYTSEARGRAYKVATELANLFGRL